LDAGRDITGSSEDTMHISRRMLLAGSLTLAASLITRSATAAKATVTVYKSPT
jgi:hypothetical protein